MDFSKEIKLYKKPFLHGVIKDFLPEANVKHLLASLQQQSFTLLNSDLFTFLQTKDLNNVKEFQTIKETLLSLEFIQLIEQHTNTKLSPTKLDLFGNIYKNTHYLLPHDDQLESRAVAFIFYLSTLKQSGGGALTLYNSNNNMPTTINKRVQPQRSTLVFFKVTPQSFHEVEEVLTNTDRIALTGWFYHD